MIQIKKLLLVMMSTLLGSVVYGMEKEQSSLLELPRELRQDIASLLLKKELEPYDISRKQQVIETLTTGPRTHDLFRAIEVISFISSAAFSPDSKAILTGGSDKIARLWDVKTGKEIKSFTGHAGSVTSVAFSPDGKTILTGSEDTTARLWEVETGKPLKLFKGHTDWVTSVAFSPDGKTILTGSRDYTARLWDVVSELQLKQFLADSKSVFSDRLRPWVTSVAFSPDGKTILTGSWDKTARLWDVEKGYQLKEFKHTTAVRSVAFSPDGTTILTGSNDHTAILWNVETGKLIKEFQGHDNVVDSVAFSPDGKTILTGSYDKTARVWDVESGEQLKKFKYDRTSVESVAFSKDGEMIMVALSTNVRLYRQHKESEEETKELIEKIKQTVPGDSQEKLKLLLNP